MHLKTIKAAAIPSNAPTYFALAAAHRPVLVQVSSAEAVLSLLGPGGTKDYLLRDAVLLAVIAEYQRSSERQAQFWALLLLKTFLPVMLIVSKSKQTRALKRAERQALTVQALLEATHRFNCQPGRTHVAYNLCLELKRQFHHLAKGEVDYLESTVPMELEALDVEQHKLGAVDRGPRHFRDQLAVDAPELRALLFRWLGGAFPAEELDLVADTVLSGRDVRALVRERHSELPIDEQRRIESRLHHTKGRSLKRIRSHLAKRLDAEG